MNREKMLKDCLETALAPFKSGGESPDFILTFTDIELEHEFLDPLALGFSPSAREAQQFVDDFREAFVAEQTPVSN